MPKTRDKTIFNHFILHNIYYGLGVLHESMNCEDTNSMTTLCEPWKSSSGYGSNRKLSVSLSKSLHIVSRKREENAKKPYIIKTQTKKMYLSCSYIGLSRFPRLCERSGARGRGPRQKSPRNIEIPYAGVSSETGFSADRAPGIELYGKFETRDLSERNATQCNVLRRVCEYSGTYFSMWGINFVPDVVLLLRVFGWYNISSFDIFAAGLP